MLANKEKNFISVVIYLYNEEKNIYDFLEKVTTVFDSNFQKYELILVNDFSTDKSVSEIKKFAESKKYNQMISVINMSSYYGIEKSMDAGVELSIGDFVYEFDSIQLDYPSELIMEVYQQSLKGYDIVAASSDKKVDFMSKMFYSVYNYSKDDGIKNCLKRETFRILSRRAINRVKSLSNFISYRKAFYISCGLPYYTIEYKSINSNKRKYSKQVKQNRYELAIDSIMIFTEMANKASMFISAMFMLFAVVVGIYTVCIYIGADKPVEGWTPMMGFLSVAFSGMFMMFSIVIKYLSLVLKMIFTKQKYLIESIEKISEK